jgi:CubicO group peptidase (beta-lactamase class C family)
MFERAQSQHTPSSSNRKCLRLVAAAVMMVLVALPGVSIAGLPFQADATILSILNNRKMIYMPGMAAAVVVNGKIYYNQVGVRRWGSAGAALATDRWQMGSISKPITGEWVARYVAAGYIKWTTTLNDVMPELFVSDPANPYRFVTVAQFMSHTSGLPYTPSTCDPTCAGTDFSNLVLKSDRRYKYVKEAIKDAPVNPPGTVAEYTGGAIIVTSMLERLLGFEYEDWIASTLFIPASMTSTDFNPLSQPYPNITGIFSHSWDGLIFGNGPVPQAPADKHVLRSPVGGVNSSIIGMANFLSYAMTSHPEIWETVGRSSYTPAGWGLGMKDSAGGEELRHSGCDGSNYALASVWPRRGVAVIVATNYVDHHLPDGCHTGEQARQAGAVISDILATLGTWNAPPASSPYIGEPTYGLPFANVISSNVYGCGGVSTTYPSNAVCGNSAYKPVKAFDGLFGTRWATDGGITSAWMQGALPANSVSGFVVSEAGPFNGEPGYRVSSFAVLLWNNVTQQWIVAHQGASIGAQRRISFGQTYQNITKAILSVSTAGTGLSGPTIQEFQLLN